MLHNCLVVVPNKLSLATKKIYEQFPTIKDVKEAICTLVDDKASGIDDFPCELYKALWDCVGKDLHKVYLEDFHSKPLGNLINKDNIKFIPKTGDVKDIYN